MLGSTVGADEAWDAAHAASCSRPLFAKKASL